MKSAAHTRGFCLLAYGWGAQSKMRSWVNCPWALGT